MLKNLKDNYRLSLIYFLIAFIIFESIVIIVGDLGREPWGDEHHFVETVKQFGTDFSIETLTHYNEMSGPLPFIIYSLWGRAFGFELFILRLLSILIALVSYTIFHRLLYFTFKNGIAALFATLFLMIHPYMVGFSIFVFTDGVTILFVLLSLYGVYKNNMHIFGLAMAAALISRQFAIFFLIASVFYFILKGISDNKKMLIASGLAVVPLTGLIFLWGGLSPDNAWRVMYLEDGFTFHLNYLVLYISLMFVYLFPFVIWNWKEIYYKKNTVIVSVILSFIYWLFPVGPSKYDLTNKTQTVGLFNKLLVWLNPVEWFDQAIFYICFLLGLPILITIVSSIGNKIKQKEVDLAMLLDLSVVSFLVIMPFSYLGWEKYFVPLVPILILRLLLLNHRSFKC
ncbi:MAG: hypothetical protein ABIJ12_06860 [bacterium]